MHKLKRSDWLITTDDRPITATLHYLTGAKNMPVVIFIHGFKGFKDWGHWHLLADEWASAGLAVLRINLSYNGTTPDSPTDFTDLEAFGKETFTRDLRDLYFVIRHLHESDLAIAGVLDVERLAVVGHSRGGAVALMAAARFTQIKAVATLASITNTGFLWTETNIEEIKQKGKIEIINNRTGQLMPIYRSVYEDWEAKKGNEYNLCMLCEQIIVPALIVHGTADESVPPEAAQQLQAWIPHAQCVLIEGADHTFGGEHPYQKQYLSVYAKQVAEVVEQFFMSVL